MKQFYFSTLLLFLAITSLSQTKNFLDQPYLEVTGKADTLVTPDGKLPQKQYGLKVD